ncbi:hypothetical protein [Microlunatus speluncae]|uniref:hypothetical protein n=1 Tax=Microlunatus speluncae TaxID=2594267 RepID=UPI0012667F00|nr:hypothetical protein [Microlunatus speluncae]
MDDDAGSGRRRRGPSRVLRIVLVGILTLAFAGVLLVTVRWPAVSAVTCPECYGMQPLTSDIYVERDLPPAERERVVRVLTAARQRISAFYGPATTAPRILVCTTTNCYRRIGGGGEAGVAVLNRALMLAPRGVTEVIASHELSHVELRQRLRGAGVPQWFNEGLAVVVSNDPRYLRPEGAGDRCRVEPAGPLPETLDAWLKAGAADDRVYARAACAVDRWARARGGRAAITDLIERLAAGETFTHATR